MVSVLPVSEVNKPSPLALSSFNVAINNDDKISSLVKNLSSEAPNEKLNAIEKLIEIAEEDREVVTDHLIKALKNGCVSAASVLGIIKAKNAIPDLANGAQSQDKNVRLYSAAALSKMIENKGAQETLINCLHDNEQNVVEVAALSLGEIGSKEAIKDLIKLLDHDDFEVTSLAMRYLAGIKDDEVLKSLNECLENNNSLTAKAHAAMLLTDLATNGKTNAKTVDLLINCLEKDHSMLRSSCAEALSIIKDPKSVEPLITSFKKLSNNDHESISYIASALIAIDDPKIFNLLTNCLTDEDPIIRLQTLKILVAKRDLRVVPILVKAFSDEDPRVSNFAKRIFGDLNEPAINGGLSTCLKDTPDLVSVIETLGYINEPKVVPFLIKCFIDEDLNNDTRIKVRDTLIQLHEKTLYYGLLMCALSNDENIRNCAKSLIEQQNIISEKQKIEEQLS